MNNVPAHLQLGKSGEHKALQFLKKKNFRILTTNFSCAYGEVDIIAQDRDVLVFVEVKTRSDDLLVDPTQAVSKYKVNRIFLSGELYMRKNHIEADYRCDVIAILPDTIEHFENVSMDW